MFKKVTTKNLANSKNFMKNFMDSDKILGVTFKLMYQIHRICQIFWCHFESYLVTFWKIEKIYGSLAKWLIVVVTSWTFGKSWRVTLGSLESDQTRWTAQITWRRTYLEKAIIFHDRLLKCNVWHYFLSLFKREFLA